MAFLRGKWRSAAVLPLLFVGLLADNGCYDTGDGNSPPLASFYFPVGLQVSHGGTVLYAVNSNFDLQFNGGTLQSYDLRLMRQHALLAIANPADPALPLLHPPVPKGACPSDPPVVKPGTVDVRQPLGETCAPPVDSRAYFRDSAIIGAFATDLLLSPAPADLQGDFLVSTNGGAPVVQSVKMHADDPPVPAGSSRKDRLFMPVRGNATLTWASVDRDDFDSVAVDASYGPFHIDCGQDASKRCNAIHQIGENENEEGNTRHLKLPGEPFGATISDDGTSIVMTHQNDTKSTLLSTGLSRTSNDDPRDRPLPALQFVVDKVPVGGIGVANIPHDPDAFLGALALPRPAVLETSRAVAAVSLLRRYSDEEGGVGPSTPRPFLDLEATFPITATPSGIDSRGIAIDPTPRLACKAKVAPVGGDQTVESRDRKIQACARKPARVFIANRAPASLLVGDVGLTTTSATAETTYDPDRLTIHTALPLPVGPSQVFLAPVVDRDGAYALRVFVVCYDASAVFVYDPDAGALENVIRVGPGPFAMAFDPFSFDDVARHAQVPIDPRDQNIGLRRYRFAYLASFTQSFMQLIDLDNAASPVTYERIVYTVGLPTNPKGS
jgi:hypothetical protein